MSYFQAVIMGLIQGLTEFLPVSSSGHLALASALMNIDVSLSFTVWLHLGTLAAVCIHYRKTLLYLLTHPKDKRVLYLLTASAPTFVAAALFKYLVPESVYRYLLPVGFFITIVLLLLSDKIGKGNVDTRNMGIRRAVVTGSVQGAAVISGLSRSGATIFALTSQDINRPQAGEFSFLLSIPVILGGGLVEALSAFKAHAATPVLPVLAGVACAALTGFIAIKLMLRIISNRSLKYFAYYLLIPFGLSILIL